MDIRYLQTLLHVIDGGSLAEAARRQNLTAAAVGQRLKALEYELGQSLVQRAGATVSPTSACLRMMPRVQSIIAETALLTSDLAEDGLAGPYRLGVISTALADHVTSLVRHFEAVAPNIELKITPGSSTRLFEQVTHSELDAALIVEPSFQLPKSMTVTAVEKQPFAWIIPSETTSEELPLILYDRSSWGGELAWRWIDKNVRSPNILCEMDAPETVAGLVSSGAGRAILPIWKGLSKMAAIKTQVISEMPKRSIAFVHAGSPIDRACVKFFKEHLS
ncbi:LysR substrate-binding domain-containing protein [uncultured Sulfitobacter sp.]|uniref:LysR substrate-binding domain-containing protein n=1 Tax=uncultured Sulfitobacter sp. TaxID=191468 RepID=UPI002596A35A|nr:LysR substrate-binding domain-containing protein [uncultured Sulfitobacter sp.]